MDTVTLIRGKASSVLSWVSLNFTAAVRQLLAFVTDLSKLWRLCLIVLLISRRAVSTFAFLRVNPSASRPCIEQNIHFLWWVSEPELALVPHILNVHKVQISGHFILLSQRLWCYRHVQSLGKWGEKVLRHLKLLEKWGRTVSFLDIDRNHLIVWLFINFHLDCVLMHKEEGNQV